MQINVTDREGCEHIIEGYVGEPLMFPLSDDNLVEATCGGSCSCATCHLYVAAGWLEKLPAPAADEAEILQSLPETQANSRLGCQVEMTDRLHGIQVTVAPESDF